MTAKLNNIKSGAARRHKERKWIDADTRQIHRAKLTNEQQLARLDLRPGNSTKERARLSA